VGPASARFFVQPGSINEVVEEHARRNEKKFALSGCDERHLFVLFDFTSPEGWNAFMEQREPPALPPQLPEAITTVWVAFGILKRFACSDDMLGVSWQHGRHETNRLPPQRPRSA